MQAIFLEFRHENASGLAANGTDTTMYLDGRWGEARRREEIYARVQALRELRGTRYVNQLFVGYTISGHWQHLRPGTVNVPMPDRHPPAWFRVCGFHHCAMPVRFIQAPGESPGVGRWEHIDSRHDYSPATGRGHAARID